MFAFALNNQHDATVHFFFGTRWSAPLVLVVLTAFTAGVAVGVLGMAPRWWRGRRRLSAASAPPAEPDSVQASELPPSVPHHGS